MQASPKFITVQTTDIEWEASGFKGIKTKEKKPKRKIKPAVNSLELSAR